MKTSLACLSVLLLSAATFPAYAQGAQEIRREVVRTDDVDAYSTQGADTIVRRIENAADHVCGAQGGAMPLPQRADINDCSVDAEEDAIHDANNPVLTARYYGYSPQVVVAEGDTDDGYYAPPVKK